MKAGKQRAPLGPGAKSLERGSTFANPRSRLKRTSRRRPDPGRARVVDRISGGYCWFVDVLDLDPFKCSAPFDPCHLLPKALLEDRGISSWDRWDERVIVNGCRYHHRNSTPDGTIYIVTRDLLPIGFEEYVAEHDLEALASRFYGEGRAVEQTAPEISW